MTKKNKIAPEVEKKMGQEWQIEVSAEPFFEAKGANMPSFGYPCAHCNSESTRLRFAKSTDEENSNLEWITLHCKECDHFSRYTRR